MLLERDASHPVVHQNLLAPRLQVLARPFFSIVLVKGV